MATQPTSTTATTTVPADAGATMATRYLGQDQDLTLIDMDDLYEFQSSAKEEFRQFSIGGFFMSGAAWLFVERVFEKPLTDPLLLFCVFSIIAGAVVAWYGFKQLKRRRGKIERIIQRAEANRVTAAATESTKSS